MALLDLFAGTSSLESHTSDSGHSWNQLDHGGGARTLRVADGVCYCDAAAGPNYGIALASWLPESADYTVTGVAVVNADVDWAGLVGRAVGTNQDTDLDCYFLLLMAAANTLTLYRLDDGALTQIGTAAATIAVGNTYTYSLRFVGTTVKGILDGVELISVTDATYTAAGSAGVGLVRPGSGAVDDVVVLASVAADVAATGYTLTGPSGGAVGAASHVFTVTASGTLDDAVAVTPAYTGGSVSVPTVTLPAGSPVAQTFTVTPSAAGDGVVSCTDDGGLTDPAALDYVAFDGVTRQFWANFPGGGVGAVGYTVYEVDGTPYLSRTTAGVTDRGGGLFTADIPLPTTLRLKVVFDDTIRTRTALVG